MSYSVSGKTITMTRGDTAYIYVTPKYKETGDVYEPQEGDSILFTVKRKATDTEALIEKEIPTATMQLCIKPEDTKPLRFGDYVFDIQMTYANGDVDTFITEGTFVITAEVSE